MSEETFRAPHDPSTAAFGISAAWNLLATLRFGMDGALGAPVKDTAAPRSDSSTEDLSIIPQGFR
jgi:hypothetical protein